MGLSLPMNIDGLSKSVTALTAIESEEAASGIVGALAGVLHEFGFRHLLITGLPICENELWHKSILYDGWPAEWFAHYAACDHFRHDPCAHRSRKTADPFLWSQLSTIRMSSRQARVMQEAAEFKMSDGLCVPIHQPLKAPAVVTVAGNDIHVGRNDLPILEMVCIHAFRSLQHLHGAEKKTVQKQITAREREVLTWIAAGKTAEDIACILAISKFTVDRHLRNIREKFDAINTVHAVIQAVVRGDIQP